MALRTTAECSVTSPTSTFFQAGSQNYGLRGQEGLEVRAPGPIPLPHTATRAPTVSWAYLMNPKKAWEYTLYQLSVPCPQHQAWRLSESQPEGAHLDTLTRTVQLVFRAMALLAKKIAKGLHQKRALIGLLFVKHMKST